MTVDTSSQGSAMQAIGCLEQLQFHNNANTNSGVRVIALLAIHSYTAPTIRFSAELFVFRARVTFVRPVGDSVYALKKQCRCSAPGIYVHGQGAVAMTIATDRTIIMPRLRPRLYVHSWRTSVLRRARICAADQMRELSS